MGRERGEKGKHGETDREIVFTILHNQMKLHRGITKKEIARIVEDATGKDRDGVRKRITHILGQTSPLREMIYQDENDFKKYYRIIPKNLLEVAKLYNFMALENKFLKLNEISEFFSKMLWTYMDEVVDYLYLWDPFDPVNDPYSLPEWMLREMEEKGKLDFYPSYHDVVRQYPIQDSMYGPQLMKEVMNDFGITFSIYREISFNGKERFFRLIEGFESLKEQLSTADSLIYSGELKLKNHQPFHYNFVSLQNLTNRALPLVDDMIWFMGLWSTSWNQGRHVGTTRDAFGSIERLEEMGIEIPDGDQTIYQDGPNQEGMVTLYDERFMNPDEMFSLGIKYRKDGDYDHLIRSTFKTELPTGVLTTIQFIFPPEDLIPDMYYRFYTDVKFEPNGKFYKLKKAQKDSVINEKNAGIRNPVKGLKDEQLFDKWTLREG